MRLLRMGSTGPGVQLLQLALNRAGYGELQTDGIFGPLTERAVRRFQAAQNILTDGIAGRDTHRRLLPWYTGNLLYHIQKGDTFSALAERYGPTVEAIALANPEANPENLQIGETITIPLPFPVVPTDIAYSAALVNFCVRGLQMRYPFIGTGDIGQSVMGKPIWYLKLGSGDNAVLYNASHHANEWITTPLLLKFAEDLAAASAAGENIFDYSAAALLDHASMTLIPAVNPDGIDLVTGELQQGEFYRGAGNIADDWPDIPFPEGWKANIRGTDLNLQYPAGWEEAKKIKYAQGVQGPAPVPAPDPELSHPGRGNLLALRRMRAGGRKKNRRAVRKALGLYARRSRAGIFKRRIQGLVHRSFRPPRLYNRGGPGQKPAAGLRF